MRLIRLLQQMDSLVVALFMGGILVGAALGAWVTSEGELGAAGQILAAGMGAAVAVFGAIFASEYREKAARRELRAILGQAVDQILVGAKELIAVTRSDDSDYVYDRCVISMARMVIARWQHMAHFAPYRQLADFRAVAALLEVEHRCRALQPMADDPPAKVTAEPFQVEIPATRDRFVVARDATFLIKACEAASDRLAIDHRTTHRDSPT